MVEEGEDEVSFVGAAAVEPALVVVVFFSLAPFAALEVVVALVCFCILVGPPPTWISTV